MPWSGRRGGRRPDDGYDECPANPGGKHPRGMRGCGCSKDPLVIAARRAAAGLEPKDTETAPGRRRPATPRGRLRTCNSLYVCSVGGPEAKEHNRLYGHLKHWCLERWYEPGVHSRHKCARPGCSYTW
jgi:hypothetical protein